jgi:hypothetical protein
MATHSLRLTHDLASPEHPLYEAGCCRQHIVDLPLAESIDKALGSWGY